MKLQQANVLKQQGKEIIQSLNIGFDKQIISYIINEFNTIRSRRVKNIEAFDYALSQMVERKELADATEEDLNLTIYGYFGKPYIRTFFSILNKDKRGTPQQKIPTENLQVKILIRVI